mmetsp:Transcript_125004/g.324724  ORF Transcript_125004/g.324724 Transcript_125004/m.324724 type:complete len:87 (-) Transcript_125004:95-355(-)
MPLLYSWYPCGLCTLFPPLCILPLKAAQGADLLYSELLEVISPNGDVKLGTSESSSCLRLVDWLVSSALNYEGNVLTRQIRFFLFS